MKNSKMMKLIKSGILFLAMALFVLESSFAYSPTPPEAYEVKSKNGEYILYMNPKTRSRSSSFFIPSLTPCRREDTRCMHDLVFDVLSQGEVAKAINRAKKLCKKESKNDDEPACKLLDESRLKYYLPSGLYRNVNNELSGDPLWTVDFYPGKVFLSNDAKRLVVPGNRATSLSDPAVSFYRNGHEIKSYKIEELLDPPSCIIKKFFHFSWRWDSQFFPDKDEYYLKTCNGIDYYFDIKTGEITGTNDGILRRILKFLLG